MSESERHVIFVKHSLPEITPDIPANQWRLSEEGRDRCRPLTEALRVYSPDLIFASIEPKASETAALIGEVLKLPYQTVENLHEHQRDNETFDQNAAHFQEKIAQFFSRPNQLIYGRETADQAHQRFEKAVRGIVEKHPHQTIVIVAHGTVISLLLAHINQFDPFPFWKSLGLPSFAVTTTTFRLLKVVTGVKSD